MGSHVGISLPQQRKPSFQPIRPQMRPPSMPPGPGTGTLPFYSFDPASVQASAYSMPPTIQTADSFDNEPPLLEELGINTSLILRKTTNILNPLRINSYLHEDADLSGPFVYIMFFGLFQLLAGKLQFGVILGWLVVASLFVTLVFNMLEGNDGDLKVYRCMSYVGYSLLPVVIFSAFQLFLPRGGMAILLFACLAVIWSTRTCTSLLVSASLHAEESRSLIGYSCALIYTAFSLLVVF
ncbi:hypothetical protein KP509_12G076400 [Ceratopteris richardii]|nr:hypothetical protein KP509_12G076400 [Ceratopteris richardii]